ncbi:hypothetical protein ABZZ79_34935 [Streptomyces sp. NPDC006458]|uniref:hypothetical protein n=1 Tax=Streptomyces TaxID=1883 RepID=UPI00339DD7F4
MTTITAEKSAPKSKRAAPFSRPLTRKQMIQQRMIEWRKPGHEPAVGMLLYRPAADDPHAKWLVSARSFGSVLVQRVPWPAVEAGEFWGVPSDRVTAEERRTLTCWFRRELAEREGEGPRSGTA